MNMTVVVAILVLQRPYVGGSVETAALVDPDMWRVAAGVLGWR